MVVAVVQLKPLRKVCLRFTSSFRSIYLMAFSFSIHDVLLGVLFIALEVFVGIPNAVVTSGPITRSASLPLDLSYPGITWSNGPLCVVHSWDAASIHDPWSPMGAGRYNIQWWTMINSPKAVKYACLSFEFPLVLRGNGLHYDFWGNDMRYHLFCQSLKKPVMLY